MGAAASASLPSAQAEKAAQAEAEAAARALWAATRPEQRAALVEAVHAMFRPCWLCAHANSDKPGPPPPLSAADVPALRTCLTAHRHTDRVHVHRALWAAHDAATRGDAATIEALAALDEWWHVVDGAVLVGALYGGYTEIVERTLALRAWWRPLGRGIVIARRNSRERFGRRTRGGPLLGPRPRHDHAYPAWSAVMAELGLSSRFEVARSHGGATYARSLRDRLLLFPQGVPRQAVAALYRYLHDADGPPRVPEPHRFVTTLLRLHSPRGLNVVADLVDDAGARLPPYAADLLMARGLWDDPVTFRLLAACVRQGVGWYALRAARNPRDVPPPLPHPPGGPPDPLWPPPWPPTWADALAPLVHAWLHVRCSGCSEDALQRAFALAGAPMAWQDHVLALLRARVVRAPAAAVNSNVNGKAKQPWAITPLSRRRAVRWMWSPGLHARDAAAHRTVLWLTRAPLIQLRAALRARANIGENEDDD